MDKNGQAKKPTSMVTVVAASAAGTAFEWYDFFLFVPLASIMAKTFFAGLDPTSAYIFALGAFAVGFAFRPIGALIFGRIGDRIGRKATFLATMSLMGVSTFAIGLLPSFETAGIVAPLLFVLLRLLQGLAGGGADIRQAFGGSCEHVSLPASGDSRRRRPPSTSRSAGHGPVASCCGRRARR